ncbi:DUF3592 domain-containing protein [Nonomuraea basaltis]|uniref:DUF3592 domain-containing protein n=1 Tax=Nonomuraea basaltis TaxID=2495887 RepID=UPI00110C4CDC|nr:DUF3592 domain-containing protein [Nonomuraea basaltis]TMR92325.1 DUF3592 domain-containing protein [Nonomuraea basaltis]
MIAWLISHSAASHFARLTFCWLPPESWPASWDGEDGIVRLYRGGENHAGDRNPQFLDLTSPWAGSRDFSHDILLGVGHTRPMHNGRLFTIVGGIFGLIGLVLLCIGVGLAASTASFLTSAKQTDGTVVALTARTTTTRSSDGRARSDTSWYPTVEFTVDGRRYSFQSSTGSNPPSYKKGESVPVAYDPADPSNGRIASVWSAFLAPLIVGGLGVVFTPIGAVLFVKGRRITRLRAWLWEQGQQVWAEIEHVGRDFAVRVNNRHPYVVHAMWQDERTGRTYTAASDYLRDDPGPRLQGQTRVLVLYDAADPERNLVDLDARPSHS